MKERIWQREFPENYNFYSSKETIIRVNMQHIGENIFKVNLE